MIAILIHYNDREMRNLCYRSYGDYEFMVIQVAEYLKSKGFERRGLSFFIAEDDDHTEDVEERYSEVFDIAMELVDKFEWLNKGTDGISVINMRDIVTIEYER